MHFAPNWNAVLGAAVAIGTLVLRQAVLAPRVTEVATELRHVADDVAALFHTAAPEAPLADKVQAVVRKLDAVLPGNDPDVLERAATGALCRIGAAAPAVTVGTVSNTA